MPMYPNVLTSAFSKLMNISAASDTVKVALGTAYTYAATHQFFDVAPFPAAFTETTGTGYTAGGLALTGLAITPSATPWVWTANSAAWTGSTFSARYAVLYDSTPVSSKPLIAYFDFGSSLSVTAGTFTINWNAGGIISISVS